MQCGLASRREPVSLTQGKPALMTIRQNGEQYDYHPPWDDASDRFQRLYPAECPDYRRCSDRSAVQCLVNAVVRGDVCVIRIGARVNIQDNATIHVFSGGIPTILGEGVSVAHNVVVHACTIGDFTLVGMGAIVLDGLRWAKSV